MSGLHIGLDLDNTIIDYGGVFAEASVETGLLTPGHALTTKDEVRAHLRAGPGGSLVAVAGGEELVDGVNDGLAVPEERGMHVAGKRHEVGG